MFKPANAFDPEKRVWFWMDNVVAYDEEHDIALCGSNGRRRAGSAARYFAWSHWLRGEKGGRDQEQLFVVTGHTLAEAIEKANKRLEKEA